MGEEGWGADVEWRGCRSGRRGEEGSQGHTFNSEKVRGLNNEETEKMRNCRGGGVKKSRRVFRRRRRYFL